MGCAGPYVWAGSNHEQLGKYIADGVWSATADDTQIGVLTVLRRIAELRPDVAAKLNASVPAAPSPAPTVTELAKPTPPAPATPKTTPAQDVRTGGIAAALLAAFAGVAAFASEHWVALAIAAAVLILAVIAFLILRRKGLLPWTGQASPSVSPASAPPTIGGLLGGLAGPAGAAIGAKAGEILAGALGVPATPEAVGKAIDADPDAAEKLQQAEEDHADALIAQAQAEIAKTQVTAVNASIQAETAASVAAGDGWRGQWRWLHAWELTLECPVWLGLFVYVIVSGNVVAFTGLASLQGLIMAYMGARFGVLGVHVWQGSNERQVAIASPAATTSPAALLAGLVKR